MNCADCGKTFEATEMSFKVDRTDTVLCKDCNNKRIKGLMTPMNEQKEIEKLKEEVYQLKCQSDELKSILNVIGLIIKKA